jgi:thymidine kinase
MKLYNFSLNSFQYVEYLMKYKEKLLLTTQCGICGTVNYVIVDFVCGVNELLYEVQKLQSIWLENLYLVFMK